MNVTTHTTVVTIALDSMIKNKLDNERLT